jgi:hypothetical protein
MHSPCLEHDSVDYGFALLCHAMLRRVLLLLRCLAMYVCGNLLTLFLAVQQLHLLRALCINLYCCMLVA